MTTRTDTFNRADTTNAIGTPSDGGSAWEQLSGAWGITGNKGYDSSVTGVPKACVLESSDSNVTVQVTATGTLQNLRVVARAANNSNYVYVVFSGGSSVMEIWKNVAGVHTQLAVYSGAFNSGDVIKMVADAANLITGYQNGVSRLSVTESAGSTNTKHGIGTHTDQTGSQFDDLSITPIAGGVRAIVELLATAGVGGTGLQRLVYAVTFFGDDVPPMAELPEQKQVEIEVAMPNDFTSAELRASIVAAVQERAIELGLTIFEPDVLTLTGASA